MTEEEQKKLEKLYDKYNHCRDYELDRFWKNSVFVWTFLAVCFTAYGSLLFMYMGNKSNMLENYFPLLSTIICTIALILSLYWLWLSKASKAWYEVFEIAVWNIESMENVFDFEKKYLIHNFWFLKTEKDFSKKKIFEKMFSTRNFSPSKIVFSIAWLLILFWIGSLFFGLIVYYVDSEICSIIFLGIGVLLFIAFLFISRYNINSTTLRDYSDQKIFESVRDKMENNILPYLYFEVKKGVIAFFFSDEKAKIENVNKIKSQYINYNCYDALDCNYVFKVNTKQTNTQNTKVDNN